MDDKAIGKVIATEKTPTTIDNFFFWTKPDFILHPFDIVKVEHLAGSVSFGMVEEISHITDAASYLTSFVSNDFGEADSIEATYRIGMNYVKVKVVFNDKGIDSPVLSNKKVYLATKEEVQQALGLTNIKNPVVCGDLDMYEDAGEKKKVPLPVNMNADFLVGPDGAHLNISGISGLAAKTSYGMFLLKAIQDKSIASAEATAGKSDDVAIVVFNVKGNDLLAIDEQNKFDDNADKRKQVLEQYKMLGLSPEPFKNVSYLYPASDHNRKNSYVPKEQFDKQKRKHKAMEYKFTYAQDKQNIDLLFAGIDDPNQTIDAIVDQILRGDGGFKKITEWGRLLEEIDKMQESGNTSKSKEIPVQSWRKFARNIKKAISNNILFGAVDAAAGEVRIADKINSIRANDVYVVDIAKLDSDMQAFVFGSTVRAII